MPTLILRSRRRKNTEMSPASPDDLVLRDRVVAAMRLNRELTEHVEQALIPKVHALRRLTRADRPADDPPPGDKTVHAQAAAVLEADHFTVELYEKLRSYCDSIRRSVEAIGE